MKYAFEKKMVGGKTELGYGNKFIVYHFSAGWKALPASGNTLTVYGVSDAKFTVFAEKIGSKFYATEESSGLLCAAGKTQKECVKAVENLAEKIASKIGITPA